MIIRLAAHDLSAFVKFTRAIELAAGTACTPSTTVSVVILGGLPADNQ